MMRCVSRIKSNIYIFFNLTPCPQIRLPPVLKITILLHTLERRRKGRGVCVSRGDENLTSSFTFVDIKKMNSNFTSEAKTHRGDSEHDEGRGVCVCRIRKTNKKSSSFIFLDIKENELEFYLQNKNAQKR